MLTDLKSDRPELAEHTLSRVNVLGTGIAAVNLSEALTFSLRRIMRRSPHRMHFCTVHTVMEARGDGRLRRLLNEADFAVPDGMPLAWLARHAGHKRAGRVYGPDFMLGLCERGLEHGLRHFLYGGGPGVAPRLADALTRRFPGLEIAGAYTPPVRPVGAREDATVLQRIDASGAHVVWVGLGTPKQDFWLAQHRPLLRVPLLAAVGAAFDFHAGLMPQAPSWMQTHGLEWLYRLSREPRRLWYRYLVYNPLFMLGVFLQQLDLRQYPLDIE